jgi:uncharacterized membrane protein YfcA
MMPLFLSFAFFIGFVVEGMIGLGGTLIAYSFLLFFFDVKTLIISTIIIPIFASFVILFTDVKQVRIKVLLINVPICIAGGLLGIALFEYLPGWVILKMLATFLILFGLRSIFFGEIILKGFLGKVIVFISGIVHGLIGTGGPLAIIGMKSEMKTKAEIKATMALFFIILNVIRITQLSITVEWKEFFIYYWLIVPTTLGIFAGHYLHNKISEKQFKTLLSVFFIIAGILLMVR